MSILCINCRYCRSPSPVSYFCDHAANLKYSVVDGKTHTKVLPEACRERAGHCGPEAKNFAPNLEVA